MIDFLQQFLISNGAAIAAATGVVALAVSALRYGRRHEQRTRERRPGV